jgi:hypothetical protein
VFLPGFERQAKLFYHSRRLNEETYWMKNSVTLIVALSLLTAFGLGCGILGRATGGSGDTNANDNRSLTDKAVDTAVGKTKIGIPECDDAMDLLEQQANNPDDNFVTKALKQTVLNQFREKLKQAMEENKGNKTEIAKFCREFRQNVVNNMGNSNTNSRQ